MNQREISEKYKAQSIHYLHSNFYEAGLRMEEVQDYAESIRSAAGMASGTYSRK